MTNSGRLKLLQICYLDKPVSQLLSMSVFNRMQLLLSSMTFYKTFLLHDIWYVNIINLLFPLPLYNLSRKKAIPFQNVSNPSNPVCSLASRTFLKILIQFKLNMYKNIIAFLRSKINILRNWPLPKARKQIDFRMSITYLLLNIYYFI